MTNLEVFVADSNDIVADSNNIVNSEILDQINIFNDDTSIREILEIVPNYALILNQNCKIVYCNSKFQEFVGINDKNNLLGLNAGYAIECENHFESEEGCGKSDECAFCGINNSCIMGLNGLTCIEEVTIRTKYSKLSIDLRVTAAPIVRNKKPFVLLFLDDISIEKRKLVLEHIFFNDIFKNALKISSISENLNVELPIEYEKLANRLEEASLSLMECLSAQDQLLKAEQGKLELHYEYINSKDILQYACLKVKDLAYSYNATITINPKTSSFDFKSDFNIITHALINLLINAIEADEFNSKIEIGILRNFEICNFWIHNEKMIHESIFHQIFKRNFSTKDNGRGIGTYISKLLIEKYLNGRVFFTSSKEIGTYFHIEVPFYK